MRVDPFTLRAFSLRVLEDAIAVGAVRPRRSWAIRLALAYLASTADDRRPYDDFWRALANDNEIGRNATLVASLNAIYRLCDVARP